MIEYKIFPNSVDFTVQQHFQHYLLLMMMNNNNIIIYTIELYALAAWYRNS